MSIFVNRKNYCFKKRFYASKKEKERKSKKKEDTLYIIYFLFFSTQPWWLSGTPSPQKAHTRTCVTETCPCFLAGVECLEGMCNCERCGNPKNL